jgi:hypothetical protein
LLLFLLWLGAGAIWSPQLELSLATLVRAAATGPTCHVCVLGGGSRRVTCDIVGKETLKRIFRVSPQHFKYESEMNVTRSSSGRRVIRSLSLAAYHGTVLYCTIYVLYCSALVVTCFRCNRHTTKQSLKELLLVCCVPVRTSAFVLDHLERETDSKEKVASSLARRKNEEGRSSIQR